MKHRKLLAIILTVGIGAFMSSLDSSAVSLVMPLIESQFDVSLSLVEWTTTAYLLTISSLLLTFGRLSDLHGHKRIYRIGFVVFTAGSLLCGCSFNIVTLIVCRVIQAIGAGMVLSTGPAIITGAVPAKDRGKALSVTAIAVALGLCAGPVIGGALSAAFGWQSIFFINVPIGIFGTFMVLKNIPQDEKQPAVPFDIAGSVLIFTALILILLPLDISGDYDIPTAIFVALIAAGIGIAAVFIYVESRQTHPMLDISLFKNRVFAASNAAALFAYMAQFTLVLIAPFYLENLLGYPVMTSGLLYLPMPLATMCIAPISGSISDRFDSRYISSAGMLIMAAGLFMMSFFDSDSSMLYIVVCMAVTGFGFGLFQTPNNSAIMGNVPAKHRGTASGTLATMRNVGMVTGIALAGAVFSFYEDAGLDLFASQGVTGTLLQSEGFVYGLHATFLLASGIALCALVASFVKGRVKPAQQLADERLSQTS
jgi:EmrB/QacA subfamily drug resistance transporter